MLFRSTTLTALADDAVDDTELTGVLGFAQWVDDVRSVIAYYHQNEVIEGFYFDAIGQDTTEDQELALLDPSAVTQVGGVDRIETALQTAARRPELRALEAAIQDRSSSPRWQASRPDLR